jgi:hypothetical protein
MVEAAKKSVEQVTKGGGVPVAEAATALVVPFGGFGVGGGDECLKVAGGGEPVVFDLAMADRDAAASTMATADAVAPDGPGRFGATRAGLGDQAVRGPEY